MLMSYIYTNIYYQSSGVRVQTQVSAHFHKLVFKVSNTIRIVNVTSCFQTIVMELAEEVLCLRVQSLIETSYTYTTHIHMKYIVINTS
jgi:hypothetical protein